MQFRFEGLEIWQRAAELARQPCDIADRIRQQRRYRFAEQLYGAALSMPNNIAEGSGSTSPAEFALYLNFARRSLFENASMISMFATRGLATPSERDALLPELAKLSPMITAFARTLKQGSESEEHGARDMGQFRQRKGR